MGILAVGGLLVQLSCSCVIGRSFKLNRVIDF